MEFLQFLVQCMSTSLLFSLTLNWTLQQISSRSSNYIGRPIIEVLTKTFHPQGHNFFQVFEEKKKWQGKYFIFNGGWRNSCDCKCILFQYCWQTCKNNLYWYCKRSIPNQVSANMQEMYVAVVQFYRHCLWRWADHKFK